MTVDFGDDMASTLAELREMAESNMRDECTITRAGEGKGPWNEAEGDYDPPPRTTIYSGKCRVQIASVMGDAKSVDAGERDGTTQGSVLQLPVLTSGDVAINDVVELTECVNDPSLIGRMFTIKGRHGKSQATARRLRVEEGVG